MSKRTSVMGILNVTPDSFSDGGHLYTDGHLDMDKVLRHVDKMIGDGADIIDIGGESTRPGFEVVSVQDEIDRVTPVIENVKARFDIKISLDTYKAKTAQAGLDAGADIINDIGMMIMDPGMKDVILQNSCEYVLVHNKENYVNLFGDLDEILMDLKNEGMDMSKIILDPGIGFNKTFEQNLYEIKMLPELCKYDNPVLLGVSNKSVIGNALNLPIGERLEGTIALSVMAVMAGVDIIRVHDVKANVRAIRMAEAVLEV